MPRHLDRNGKCTRILESLHSVPWGPIWTVQFLKNEFLQLLWREKIPENWSLSIYFLGQLFSLKIFGQKFHLLGIILYWNIQKEKLSEWIRTHWIFGHIRQCIEISRYVLSQSRNSQNFPVMAFPDPYRSSLVNF